MSLLREIQDDLSTKDIDLTSVLRKCKILAARLGSEEFARWVNLELNGYPDGEAVPEYRRLHSYCYASFFGAWQISKQAVPWGLIDEDIRKLLEHRDVTTGIAGIASLVNGGGIVNLPQLVFDVHKKMYPQLNCHQVWMETSSGQFKQLLSAVSNKILDFVLQIEA